MMHEALRIPHQALLELVQTLDPLLAKWAFPFYFLAKLRRASSWLTSCFNGMTSAMGCTEFPGSTDSISHTLRIGPE